MRRSVAWVVFVLLTAVAAGCSSSPTATAAPARYYLALGDSLSVGFQPTADRPKGAETDRGYADDLEHAEAASHPGLHLVKLGCPGETTTTMMNGGLCHYQDGSQLAQAVAFLAGHRSSTDFVTVDIGANDLDGCAPGGTVDAACLSRGFENLNTKLDAILARLRQAGRPGLPILTMNLYDPFLAGYLLGDPGKALATASLPLLRQANTTIAQVAARYRIPTADVAASFDSYDMTTTESLSGHGTVPAAVAHLCNLTWMCAPPGPNIHPNDAGYRTIAGAFSPLVPKD